MAHRFSSLLQNIRPKLLKVGSDIHASPYCPPEGMARLSVNREPSPSTVPGTPPDGLEPYLHKLSNVHPLNMIIKLHLDSDPASRTAASRLRDAAHGTTSLRLDEQHATLTSIDSFFRVFQLL